MALGMGFSYRALAIIQFMFVMTPRFYSGCFALVAPSNISVRMQQRVATKALSMASSVDGTATEAALLEPTAVSSKVFSSDQRPVILFDGVCNMCNNAVNLALDWDPEGKLRFSALQSNVGRSLLEANGRKADDISSIVLVTKDGAFIKSDAVLKITEELTPLSLLPLKPAAVLGRYIVPKFLRDIIYDGVADNRYSIMGTRNECRLDSDGEFENRFVKDDIALKKE
mmetsp:Transcript_22481/g.55731  ORF Transcript_22481/g.55731 Transcript_22481/m.55731 type:complete len:227 (-) Transcript_22481:714-1394(-)|eukprot:CAMPEP_0116082682 /NCGR_PEP_ID=MMETSP0327-20121206/2859_1 /TAXON_ID=44447 /ORGANISM="Pseudo-nitzschia delicatissima, Strain B596" /LENGTH=226 /DNA_ID=CAMNT_0003573497 /DNA_START=207 /DNA_END=887 /DNA_ORIENTATION=+